MHSQESRQPFEFILGSWRERDPTTRLAADGVSANQDRSQSLAKVK